MVHLLDTLVDTSQAELARIKVPTLVLTGAEDGHDDSAPSLASALANGRYIRLPGNHWSTLTTPEFETAVTEFLGGGNGLGTVPSRARAARPVRHGHGGAAAG